MWSGRSWVKLDGVKIQKWTVQKAKTRRSLDIQVDSPKGWKWTFLRDLKWSSSTSVTHFRHQHLTTKINFCYAVETEFDFAYEKQNYTNRFSNSILRKFIKYLLLLCLFDFIFEKNCFVRPCLWQYAISATQTGWDGRSDADRLLIMIHLLCLAAGWPKNDPKFDLSIDLELFSSLMIS